MGKKNKNNSILNPPIRYEGDKVYVVPETAKDYFITYYDTPDGMWRSFNNNVNEAVDLANNIYKSIARGDTAYKPLNISPEVTITEYKPIRLKTFYPLHEGYPMTGHSVLNIPITSKVMLDYTGEEHPFELVVDKQPDAKDYNLVTNNCADATLKYLNYIFGTNERTNFFTTPGDVRDFAINKLKGKVITDKNGNDTVLIPRTKKNADKLSEKALLLYEKEPDYKTAKWYRMKLGGKVRKMQTAAGGPLYPWTPTVVNPAVQEWASKENTNWRLTPASRSNVFGGATKSINRNKKPESSEEYTKRRIKEETKRTWRSDVADILHGIGEAALSMHPYTAIPYFGAKVLLDLLSGNYGWWTALNASIPLFHISPQAVGLREATNVALEDAANLGSKTARNWRVAREINEATKLGVQNINWRPKILTYDFLANNYGFPKSFRLLGAESEQRAFLGDDGYVYKIPKYGVSDGTFVTKNMSINHLPNDLGAKTEFLGIRKNPDGTKTPIIRLEYVDPIKSRLLYLNLMKDYNYNDEFHFILFDNKGLHAVDDIRPSNVGTIDGKLKIFDIGTYEAPKSTLEPVIEITRQEPATSLEFFEKPIRIQPLQTVPTVKPSDIPENSAEKEYVDALLNGTKPMFVLPIEGAGANADRLYIDRLLKNNYRTFDLNRMVAGGTPQTLRYYINEDKFKLTIDTYKKLYQSRLGLSPNSTTDDIFNYLMDHPELFNVSIAPGSPGLLDIIGLSLGYGIKDAILFKLGANGLYVGDIIPLHFLLSLKTYEYDKLVPGIYNILKKNIERGTLVGKYVEHNGPHIGFGYSRPQITAENAANITSEQWTAAQDAAIAKALGISPEEAASLTKEQYEVAVANGADISEVLRLRDLHASVNGYNPSLSLYHGSPETFNEFEAVPNLGGYVDYHSHFGTNPVTALKFGDVRRFYTNVKAPLRVTDQGVVWDPLNLAKELGVQPKGGKHPLEPYWRDFQNIKGKGRYKEANRKFMEKELGGDAYIYDNVVEGGGDSYAIPTSRQVKSADAVTFDPKTGRRIPLGKRDNFNKNNTLWGLLPFGIGLTGYGLYNKNEEVK